MCLYLGLSQGTLGVIVQSDVAAAVRCCVILYLQQSCRNLLLCETVGLVC